MNNTYHEIINNKYHEIMNMLITNKYLLFFHLLLILIYKIPFGSGQSQPGSVDYKRGRPEKNTLSFRNDRCNVR